MKHPALDNLKLYAVKWNNRFPLDKWYRKKYQVGFGTAAHRELCQINILVEFLEDQVFEESRAFYLHQEENEKELKKGNWIRERKDPEQEDKLFGDLSNIDLNTIQY
ncbi:hypothetical protein SAMN05444266_102218 [Chitinophaga jiangningensis]|uniref:Uncharacterized protein n=1 Tax=Chitinophaga jiangningensis TaxID=1419482 RepID=A0A1M6YA63_9BACT|nr:hypothetical protein [Chitinophaga jiangningensis]SHL15002.1 hypothetical protein SAMN05444266_102218 [Chitinophaga jiangningensis]